jgi:hypothetical protein
MYVHTWCCIKKESRETRAHKDVNGKWMEEKEGWRKRVYLNGRELGRDGAIVLVLHFLYALVGAGLVCCLLPVRSVLTFGFFGEERIDRRLVSLLFPSNPPRPDSPRLGGYKIRTRQTPRPGREKFEGKCKPGPKPWLPKFVFEE